MDTKKQYKKVLQRAIKVGHLVDQSQEKSYCTKNLMRIKRLKNGSVLIGRYLNRSDSNNVLLRITFNHGAIDDPKGKQGLHHLYEHLVFSKNLNGIFTESMSDGNGSTSTETTSFELTGIFNSKFRDFSVGESLPAFLENIFNPEHSKEQVENNKRTIINELLTKESDFEFLVSREAKRAVLDKNSTYQINIAGDLKTINNLTPKDIDLMQTYFGTDDMFVGFMFDGQEEEFSLLFDFIEKELTKFNRKSECPHKALKDPIFYNLINFDLLEGNPKRIIKKITVDNGLVYTALFKILPIEFFGKEDACLSLISPYINSKLHQKSREIGFSYRVGMRTFTYQCDYAVLGAYSIEEVTNWKVNLKLFVRIFDEVLDETLKNTDLLKKLLAKEKIRQEAYPISGSVFISEAEEGMLTLGRMIDPTVTRKLKKEFSIEDAVVLIKKMREATTHTFACGKL